MAVMILMQWLPPAIIGEDKRNEQTARSTSVIFTYMRCKVSDLFNHNATNQICNEY